jgi:hypothetical protein
MDSIVLPEYFSIALQNSFACPAARLQPLAENHTGRWLAANAFSYF